MTIQVHKLELDDAAIIRAIQFARKRSPSSQLGVSDGWSSPKVLQQAEPIRPLCDALSGLVCAAPEFATRGPIWEAWANVNPHTAHTGLHSHATNAKGIPNKVSAVYFPADHPARLVFPAVGLSIEPRKGVAVLFPSDVEHCVDTNWSDAERFSIALNAY